MISEYIDLITREHREQPRFAAVVAACVGPVVQVQETVSSLSAAYSLDDAVGVQLDAVGLWIGLGRRVVVPITGVYFRWDSVADAGERWDEGTWRDPSDPTANVVLLPDDAYRLLLRLKVLANHWTGSVAGAYDGWATVTGSDNLRLTDRQNRTFDVVVQGGMKNSVVSGYIEDAGFFLRPAGVTATVSEI